MKTRIYAITVEFSGIYEMGKGWIEGARDKWMDFWERVPKELWMLIESPDINGYDFYLISVAGSCRLHPKKCTILINDVLFGEKNGEPYCEYAAEFINLCRKCAECCGGTIKVYSSNGYDTDIPLNTI